ncbi:MAG: DUF4153 domain-containing protein [Gammaproteobacteria bacterium]|nr:DUF4153 domain-containing protein [Gammaproteobacteria bacterium]
MAHDDGEGVLATRGLPVILACAVLQGWALYGLHHAVRDQHWPATSLGLLLACYAVVIYVPLTLQMLAGYSSQPLVWLATSVLALAFFGFGFHQGGYVWVNLPDGSPLDQLPTLLFILALLWLQVLPFLQGRLATGNWRFGYPVLFTKAWRNKLTLAEALLFTGLFWLLLFLWARLFVALGIGFFDELFEEPIFIYPVTALTFGIALHLIGSVERLTVTILEQLLSVLKWLGVLGTFILVIFTIALAVTLPGLVATGKWTLGAQWLLWLLAVVVLLLNAAYRDGSDPAPYPEWLGRAIRLAVPLTVLLALTALYALVVRTRQYGLTDERYWAFVVAGAALLYAVGYARAALRGGPWMRGMARVNVIGSVALMAVLALSLTPVLSPTRLSAASQYGMALSAGSPDLASSPGVERPPWVDLPAGSDSPIHWLRFEGGGYGRARLRELAVLEGHPQAARIRREAAAALAAKDWLSLQMAEAQQALDSLRVFPAGRALDPAIRAAIEAEQSGKESRWRFHDWESGKGVGLYADLNGDAQEEFLVLFPGDGQLYALQSGKWAYRGRLRPDTGSRQWDALLADLTAGRVAPDRQPWQDLLIGDRRLRVDAVEEGDLGGLFKASGQIVE